MGWIIIILVGALIGWIAGSIMGTEEQQGTIANILIGVVGSILGSWFFGSVLGIGGAVVAGTFSIWGIFWGVVGSAALIAILKAFKFFK